MPTFKRATGWDHENREIQNEFERLGKTASAIQKSTSNSTGNATGSNVANKTNNSDDTTVIAKNWAKTIKENGMIVGRPKVSQAINFENPIISRNRYLPDPLLAVQAHVVAQELEVALRTVDNAQQHVIELKALMDFVSWRDWHYKQLIDAIDEPDSSLDYESTTSIIDGKTRLTGLNIKLEGDKSVDELEYGDVYGMKADGTKGWIDLGSKRIEKEVLGSDMFDENGASKGDFYLGLLPKNVRISNVFCRIITPMGGSDFSIIGLPGPVVILDKLRYSLLHSGHNYPEIVVENNYSDYISNKSTMLYLHSDSVLAQDGDILITIYYQ